MVSKREAKGADYSPKPLRDSAFTPGPDEGATVSANSVAEVANLTIGEDGSFAEYIGVVIGRKPDPQLRSGQGKAFFNAYGDQDGDGTVEQLPDNVEVRLAGRKKRERGGRPLTEWVALGDLKNADNEGTWPLEPRPPIVRESRVITVQMRLEGDPNNDSFVYSHSDSSFKFPAQAGE